MPIVNGAYVAPTWNNDAPPAINAAELQDICDTLETYNTSKADVSYVNTFVRPNLLDNAYFVGGGSQQGGGQFPINQRGATSYVGSKYGIDRWRVWNAAETVTINSDSITIQNSDSSTQQFVQYFDSALTADLAGKELTLSVLVGTDLYSLTGPGGSKTSIATPFGSIQISVGNGGLQSAQILVSANKTASDIKAAKLEVGDTQTLAHQKNGVWVLNEIPNFEVELAKCQRYFVRFGGAVGTSNPTDHIGFVQGVNTGLVRGIIYLPVPSRLATPSISYSSVVLRNGTTDLTPTGNNTLYQTSGALNVEFTGSGFEAGKVYQIRLPNGATYDVTSDL